MVLSQIASWQLAIWRSAKNNPVSVETWESARSGKEAAEEFILVRLTHPTPVARRSRRR
ncbi:MAG: hypothetical protein LBU79_07160 [Planctomycetota bacterium]|nr:hypothetical protein [Planctomycetota bacterium]